MSFNIADWGNGDDPQLIIDFINEVMDDIRPIYSLSGWFTTEQEEEICKKYTPNHGSGSFSFYDGKILHVAYKDVEISFVKFDMSYEFTFNNIYVSLYEDYMYQNHDKIYNNSGKQNRYISSYEGFEDLLKIKGITNATITVIVKDRKEEF